MALTMGVEMTEISNRAKAARRRMARGVAGFRSMVDKRRKEINGDGDGEGEGGEGEGEEEEGKGKGKRTREEEKAKTRHRVVLYMF